MKIQVSKTPLTLIVGGSSGIGKQTGIRLLNLGAEVMLLAHNPKTYLGCRWRRHGGSQPVKKVVKEAASHRCNFQNLCTA
jgi:NAD(P)-dependent dehydrogenase (short-subunit alcohol dehydrogenase family)